MNKNKIQTISAHCDVPCGIYDPYIAQMAALSIIRMIDLMEASKAGGANDLSTTNSMTRYIMIKESEAIKVKEEIRIIWGDFIKPPHVEKHPNIHQITHNIMMLGGVAKQQCSREKAMMLLDEVNKFAVIFYAIKEMKTKTIKAPYAPNEKIVVADI
jgi:nickel superoxide dismutase